MKFLLFMLCLLTPFLATAEVTEITDKKGRTLQVKLLKLKGSQLHFKKAGQSNTISISLDKLSPASAKKVREYMATVQKEASKQPPLDIKVVVSKNNRREGDSYYMRRMAIEANVGLKNKDLNLEASECKCTLVIIGEDQKVKHDYQVLGVRQFNIRPGHQMTEHTTKPVLTRYDSDNQGYGNIGGYKYEGYLLIIQSKDNEIFASKSSISRLKVDRDFSSLKPYLNMKKGTKLDRNMEKL